MSELVRSDGGREGGEEGSEGVSELVRSDGGREGGREGGWERGRWLFPRQPPSSFTSAGT